MPNPACRPFAAPTAAPTRRRLLLPRRVLAAGATVNDQQDSSPSQLLHMAAEAGGKLTKTAVGRLGVAELREECQRLGLPSDGLKAALVERLMGWWEEDGRQQLHAQQNGGPAAEAAEQAAPATGATAAASVNATSAQPSVSPAQQQGAPQQQAPHAQQGQQEGPAGAAPGGPVSVTWLGTSSGNPTPRRNVSAIAGRRRDGALCWHSCKLLLQRMWPGAHPLALAGGSSFPHLCRPRFATPPTGGRLACSVPLASRATRTG